MDGSLELGMGVTVYCVLCGRPRVEISLHFRFMVDGYSSDQPCLTRVLTFLLSVLTKECASS